MRIGLVIAYVLLLCACTTPGANAPIRASGIAMASVDSEGRIRSYAEGCAEFDQSGYECLRPLKVDSVIRVASISKLVVALGVMRLVEQGRLNLDADISRYLGYPIRNPIAADRPITLRQLLSHTSSIIDAESYALSLGQSLSSALADQSHWDVSHQPGSYFTYANINIVIVASIMERVTHERFDRLMQRLVLHPLHVDACYNWATCSDVAVQRAAVLYRTGPDETEWHHDGPWVPQVDDLKGKRPDCPVRRPDASVPCNLLAYLPGENGALFSPQGGLRISVGDLAKVAALIVNEGKFGGVRLLKPATVREWLRPQWQYNLGRLNGDDENASMCAFGLSIQLTARASSPACQDDVFGDGIPRAGHIGEAYGLLGGVWIDPVGKTAYVYLITGTSEDPLLWPGAFSSFSRAEELAAARASRLAARENRLNGFPSH